VYRSATFVPRPLRLKGKRELVPAFELLGLHDAPAHTLIMAGCDAGTWLVGPGAE
jgi:hypothetical protein